MILIMAIKITFRIEVMKNNSITKFMEIIAINDNRHNNTKKYLGKKNKKQYLLYPHCEETALSNIQCKHHVH